MKDKILKIIHGPIQSEPIYLLEFEYRKLINQKDKNEFFADVKSIAIKGSKKEKFACLTIIEMLDKAKESEEVVKTNVDNINFANDELLISPLLTLCAIISKKWAIDFIRKVINEFKPKNKKYSYLYNIAINCLIPTEHWNEIIEEINFALTNNDETYFIDFIAYFKWKKSEDDLKKLMVNLTDENLIKTSILKPKIEERYKNNYVTQSRLL